MASASRSPFLQKCPRGVTLESQIAQGIRLFTVLSQTHQTLAAAW